MLDLIGNDYSNSITFINTKFDFPSLCPYKDKFGTLVQEGYCWIYFCVVQPIFLNILV